MPRGRVRYPARSSLGDPSGDKLGARPIDASPVWCRDTDLCVEPIAEMKYRYTVCSISNKFHTYSSNIIHITKQIPFVFGLLCM